MSRETTVVVVVLLLAAFGAWWFVIDIGREAAPRPPSPAASRDSRVGARTTRADRPQATVAAEPARRPSRGDVEKSAGPPANPDAAHDVPATPAVRRADDAVAVPSDPIEFLRALKASGNREAGLVESAESFAALFSRKTIGPTLDGAAFGFAKPPADGSSIVYPEGRFEIDADAIDRWPAFPADLEFVGAGIDRTLLVLTDDLRTGSPVSSLTFRDLTIDADSNYFERLRRQPSVIRMDHCRVVGFDSAAGRSAMLSGDVGAFFATRCRIESCFHGPSRHGVVLDTPTLLARFDDCDFVGPFDRIDQGRDGTVLFSKCRFRVGAPERARLQTARRVRLVECAFEELSDEPPGGTPRRLLSERNPAWSDAKKR